RSQSAFLSVIPHAATLTCSPTLSIIKKENEDILWASIISGEGSDVEFVMGLIQGEDRYHLGEASFDLYLDIAQGYIAGGNVKEYFGEPIKPAKKGFFARLLGL
ncbi:MAG: hypothetical protein AAGB46_01475, partial [Verrucomicrobiota bacterium]